MFGLDLLDAYRVPSRLSWRRLAVLMRNLPADSATVRAIDTTMQWTTTDYLLANIFDAVMYANWLTVEVNKRKGSRNPQPAPLPRPGEMTTKPEPRRVSGHELVQWLKG